jgi:replicative DNA helicase
MPYSYETSQKNFINLLLNHKEIIEKWLDSPLKIKHFESKYHIILESVIDSYNRDCFLTANTFFTDIQKRLAKAIAVQQEQLFNSCRLADIKKDDFHVLKNNIIENYLINNSVIHIGKFNRSQKNGNIRTSLKELVSDLNDTVSLSHDETVRYQELGSFGEEYLKYIKDLKDGKIKEDPLVKCGIKEIDETMQTGFAPGTLTLFCADVGSYKSTMMINVALNIWHAGHDVLFVPLEMPYKQTYHKIIARESKIPSERIMKGLISDEEYKKIVEANKIFLDASHKFMILEVADRTTVPFIRRQIEKYIDGFKPKLVVIDYIAGLIPEKPRRDGRNDLEIGDMLKELRAIGKRYKFAVVSGAQIGREGLRKIRKVGNSDAPTIYSEDIQGSHQYSADADVIYVLTVDPMDKNVLNIYVVKARMGKKLFPGDLVKASLIVSPEISLISSESDEMTGEDEEVLAKEYEEYVDSETSDDIDDIGIDDLDVVEW